MSVTEDVFNHHAQAIGAGDVDAIMEDYADDAVLITHDTEMRGADAIRAFFQHFVDDVVPPGSKFELTKLVHEGDHTYIIWNSESEKYKVPFSTDTFFIKDGKIALQTLAAEIIEK